MARLSVIGAGYLGVTHAVCMAHLGHEVIVIDTNHDRIAQLASGVVPFHEPELAELLTKALANGTIGFTTDWSDVADLADVHFLCVGTPQQSNSHAADMSQVFGAIDSLCEHLSGRALIVGKSTVPVGTAAAIANTLNAKFGDDVTLVWNPEFLREGFAVQDTLHPDRIVLGVSQEFDVDVMKRIYAAPLSNDTPLLVTDYATAELVKVAANAFLATKISFINAFADLADATGADITQLADAIGHDSRIGRRFLNAGVGFGGGCLPKDIRALQARATELGLAEQFAFLTAVDEINKSRKHTVVERTLEALDGSLEHKVVAVLGAAFKPDSDDIRDSPALHVAEMLADNGARVQIHDPEAIRVLREQETNLVLCESIEQALTGADVVLHLTEWPVYREIDPATAAELVRNSIIIDGRNVLDRDSWSNAGWTISYLGKPGS